jgi:hypothetical protein
MNKLLQYDPIWCLSLKNVQEIQITKSLNIIFLFLTYLSCTKNYFHFYTFLSLSMSITRITIYIYYTHIELKWIFVRQFIGLVGKKKKKTLFILKTFFNFIFYVHSLWIKVQQKIYKCKCTARNISKILKIISTKSINIMFYVIYECFIRILGLIFILVIFLKPYNMYHGNCITNESLVWLSKQSKSVAIKNVCY